MNKITDIFFDLDHTLWDFDRNSALAFRDIFAEHQLPVDIERFLAVYVPINHNYWKLFREEKISKADLRFNRLAESFDALSVSVEASLIHQLADDYITHLPKHNFLFDQVNATLLYLHEKYKLHIITNGFKTVQHQKLASSGIHHFFKTVTTSEDVGVKKPNKRIFEHAIKSAETNFETSVMIGDNLEADIEGAEQLGMKSIHFLPSATQNEERLTITQIQELRTIL